MFEQFGEFDSYIEINQKAEDLFNTGKYNDIFLLAEENGIPEDYAEMYIDGDIPEFCDATTAAIGKLDIEMQQDISLDKNIDQQQAKIIMDFLKYFAQQESMAINIRKSGKRARKIFEEMIATVKEKWKGKEPVVITSFDIEKMIRGYYK